MAEILSDNDITLLIDEKKPLPDDYQARVQIRRKRGHKERELDITGEYGSDFRLILRQSTHNPMDFSIILAYRPHNRTFYFAYVAIMEKATNIQTS